MISGNSNLPDFNNRLRQITFLLLIGAMSVLLFSQLYLFFPGFLGAITLYIISRRWFFFLTEKKSWNKTVTTVLFMLVFLICIAAPIYFSFQLLYTKIQELLSQPQKLEEGLAVVSAQIEKWTGEDFISGDHISDIQNELARLIPNLLNSSATMVGNLLIGIFLAYFIFKNGHQMEDTLIDYLPLREVNQQQFAEETRRMVTANALGIPLISLVQGVCALIGYWIFGVNDFVLLGFVTGIFAFFPVVGTAMIWLPIVIYMFSVGDTGNAIGLGIFSAVITGNVDYLARVTLLQRIGDVHPVTTILGLIVGLKLFGILGFIFGPLLISYFILLLKVYRNEFGSRHSGKG
ncbi:AI-2E family transporter [Arundinibacter roseus]|uniref:AI-2E family transporter n=1 Tax=Arundinibacter roseus TaxID=2070510 RepID=A0A4R4KI30_9BACT|nr:AI-2E family transporter [Arundinibacter roseus]TDB67523.1 AI-2E family transporter [Arundinibacter roseus]